ncbi:hypothetical protein [Clostridium sp.]|uniref:hypothetical protein n=1 Tax=Clostridium sp. TaxID=1506 RepID=UPI003216FC1A
MEYREVIAYNEDLLDSSIKVLKKKKPLSDMKGIATIELFNAETGEKIYKAETENLINNAVGRLMFFEAFYRKLRVGGGVDTSYVTFPFKRIYLSNHTGLENAEEKYFKGEVIGYADKDETYSGSSTLRGTVNLSESYSVFTSDGKIKLHFVFDFPTHAANGTFQTIYWYQGEGKDSIYSTYVNIFNTSSLGSEYSVIRDYGSYYCSDYDNTGYYLYTKNISSVYYRVFKSFYLDTSQNKQADLGYFYKEDGSKLREGDFYVNEIDADDKNIYLYYNKGSSVELYKFTLDGTWVSKTILAATSYKNIGGVTPTIKTFKIIDGVHYMSVYYVVNGQNVCHLLKLNSAYAIDRDYTLETPSYAGTSWEVSIIGKTKEYWALSDSSGVIFYDNSFNVILSKVSMSDGISSNSKRYFFSRNHNYGYCFVISSSSTPYYSYYVFGPSIIGAQTLLAAPVTKTPTNTMKIQYDFIIDNLLDGIF